jgi:hypothetical protein
MDVILQGQRLTASVEFFAVLLANSRLKFRSVDLV